MSDSDETTPSEVIDAAQRIVDKIGAIQKEARDLLTIIEDLPSTGETASGVAKLPKPWSNSSAVKLLSIEFPEGSIATTGSGPWEEDQLDSLIRGLDIEISEIEESVYIIVVGYDTDKIEEIRDHMESSDYHVQIYPQELFMSYLFTGVDPLPLLTKEQALEWIKFHPVLDALFGEEPEFPWPLIEDGEVLDREKVLSLGLDQSPLNIMGYIAGKTNGLDEETRRNILSDAFLDDIPEVEQVEDVDTEAYMAQWGTPNTPRRLWRIAKHLANLSYIHRKKSNFKIAKMHWQSDLDWLRKTFHAPRRHRFTWPG